MIFPFALVFTYVFFFFFGSICSLLGISFGLVFTVNHLVHSEEYDCTFFMAFAVFSVHSDIH